LGQLTSNYGIVNECTDSPVIDSILKIGKSVNYSSILLPLLVMKTYDHNLLLLGFSGKVTGSLG